MNIKDDIRDLERALKDAEYYAGHLISDIVSDYKKELDPEKRSEIEDLKDISVRTFNLIRYLKYGNREGAWIKPIIQKINDLYEEAKKEDDEDEN